MLKNVSGCAGPYGKVIYPDNPQVAGEVPVYLTAEQKRRLTDFDALAARLAEAEALLRSEMEHSYNPFEPDNQSDRYKRMKAYFTPDSASGSACKHGKYEWVERCAECDADYAADQPGASE